MISVSRKYKVLVVFLFGVQNVIKVKRVKFVIVWLLGKLVVLECILMFFIRLSCLVMFSFLKQVKGWLCVKKDLDVYEMVDILKFSKGRVMIYWNLINNRIRLARINLMGLLSFVLFINRKFSNLLWCWLKNQMKVLVFIRNSKIVLNKRN